MRVVLVSHTPSPEALCDLAAKVCVSDVIPREEDPERTSLRHALASGHESVLEHASFTFAIEGISRACSHQLVRHRMASYSQQSQRYVNMDVFEHVKPKSVKDVDECFDMGDDYATNEPVYVWDWLMKEINTLCHELIEQGVPEEDARYILPNACCTNLVVTMDVHELHLFFSLCCCERASWEIKQLAEVMLALVREVAPNLFADAGPRCKTLGYCPEEKGCGRMPRKEASE